MYRANSGPPHRRRAALPPALSSSALQVLLIICGLTFVIVQVRVLFVGTECTERVKALLESERKWAHQARELKLNLSALSRDASLVETQLHKLQAEHNTLSQELKEAKDRAHRLESLLDDKQKHAPSSGVPADGQKGGAKQGASTPAQTVPSPTGPSTNRSGAAAVAGVSNASVPLQPLKLKIRKVELQPEDYVAAVVVMAYNRPGYLQRTIKSILEVHKNNEKFPLFISQDGTHEGVKQLALKHKAFQYLQHIETSRPQMNSPGENVAYYRIANHYKFALSHLFDVKKFPRVILLEDDMELAPDFFDFFEATSDLLDVDPTLMAVSSWNDNGQAQFVNGSVALYRSDFFPGLGWMLRKQLWDELRPKWPKAYWDDWMRLPEVRNGRQSIRPEICRTYNFGEVGSSFGQFYRDFLAPIKLNKDHVVWRHEDLGYLMDVTYPSHFKEALNSAKKTMSVGELQGLSVLEEDVIVEYKDESSFATVAKALGIFEEWKAGIPRTSYRGVVVIRYKGPHLVYIVNWSHYNSKP